MVTSTATSGTSRTGESSRRTRQPAWLSGYWLVLALLLASYVLAAVQWTADPGVPAFLIQLLTVAVTLRVAQVSIGMRRIGWIILAVAGTGAIIVGVTGFTGHVLDVVLSSASVSSYLAAPIAIIVHQSRKKFVDGQTLLAAICAYVMVGLCFTFLYNLISLTSNAPLFGTDERDSLTSQLFFSFTTLTTTGYGNLIPSGALVESVAIMEAIAGQLFLVIAVSRVVSGWRPLTLSTTSSVRREGPVRHYL